MVFKKVWFGYLLIYGQTHSYTPSVQGPQVWNQNTTGVFTEITSRGSPECIPVEIKIFCRAVFF